jgi:hypothetical protein
MAESGRCLMMLLWGGGGDRGPICGYTNQPFSPYQTTINLGEGDPLRSTSLFVEYIYMVPQSHRQRDTDRKTDMAGEGDVSSVRDKYREGRKETKKARERKTERENYNSCTP